MKASLLKKLLTASAMLLIAWTVASADDAGLYAKPVDPNSSFVRIVDPQATSVVIAGLALNDLDQGLSPYVIVKPGEIEMSVGLEKATLSTEPGKYYTYARIADGRQKLYVDTVKDDPSKAQVYLYNLSDLPMADLFVPAAKTVALRNVAAGESGAVLLRAPLALSFAIQSDGRTVVETGTVDLKRRSGFSIVLTGSSGNYHAVAVENHLHQ
ncbi:MAG: alginate O-acetyltransferase AlgF [Phyllobacterium sp.]|uniref:alginate O-acetyltransferase AlgF n=1 Tax=Phyllobacterium sp. TaxID=1871046 RepID=UPI0030F005F6